MLKTILKIMSKNNDNIKISANMFLNIKDIQNNFLYTTTGYTLAYLKVYPKNLKLMSKAEQYNHAKKITSELVSELKTFKLYLTNRPIDTTGMTDFQANLMDNERDNQKLLLLEQRKNGLNNLSFGGQALESEIYVIIWEKDNDYSEDTLLKRINDWSLKLTNAGYKTEVLDEKSIIQLCNSYNNPDVAYIEDQNYIESPMKLNLAI